jgi:predicted TIM-barrel fold metal-dependent hydrolase
MRDYRLISADSHINEPPDLWTTRLPEKFRDRAPRIESFPQGDAYVMEGALDPMNFGGNCAAGIPIDQKSAWVRWADVRAGGYDPAARLLEQDQDGVDAEVLYPTPRVSNTLFWHSDDPEFHLACIQAYNDWLAEFCAHAPDRLWGIAIMPNIGVDAAVAEMRRVTAQPGIVGVQLGQWPSGGLDISDDDDPFFAACAEAGVPISIHVTFATGPQGEVSRGKLRGDMRFFDAPIRVSQLIGAGVFDRYPDLQVVLGEVDCGWVPYVKEQMDDRHARAVSHPMKEKPSHYWEHNISYVFITDTYGVRNRHVIGVDRMLWSSDFPHGGSDWPHSREKLDEVFAGVDEAEKQAIVAGNAMRIYGKKVLARA